MHITLDAFRGEDGKFISSTFPGLYPVLYVTRDGMTVCPDCANREVDLSQEVVGGFVFEEGAPHRCEDCGEEVESAYGDPAMG